MVTVLSSLLLGDANTIIDISWTLLLLIFQRVFYAQHKQLMSDSMERRSQDVRILLVLQPELSLFT
jgi:hypothetical protein